MTNTQMRCVMAYGVVIVDEEGVLRLGLWPSSEQVTGQCQHKASWGERYIILRH